MKKICLLFASVFLLSFQGWQQTVNNTFSVGESLTYRVYYQSFLTGKVTAGEAVLNVTEERLDQVESPVWKINADGVSKGAFNWFFKVHDTFTSYINPETLLPYLFVRRTNEGKYFKNEDSYFYHEQGYVINHSEKKNSKKTVKTNISEKVYDFVSAVYFMRTLDINSFDEEGNYFIDFFLDDSVFVSKVLFDGIEEVKIKSGTYRCLKIRPMMATGDVFSESYPMTVWVTDDKNRLPILAESKILVGSVKMELTKFENLLNSVEAKIK